MPSKKKGYGKKATIGNLGGLWNLQYAPREKIIKSSLQGEALKKWNKSSKIKKMAVIDSLQAKGFFGED